MRDIIRQEHSHSTLMLLVATYSNFSGMAITLGGMLGRNTVFAVLFYLDAACIHIQQKRFWKGY